MRNEYRYVDPIVGQRVRARRVLLGMSQEILADRLGLTFQQVQKYEKGSNRISASRLHQMSGVLGVPVSYFFEDMPENKDAAQRQPVVQTDDVDTAKMNKRETLELIRAYHRIKEPRLRKLVMRLINGIIDEQ